MKTLKETFVNLLRAETLKNTARDAYKQARPSDANYHELRPAFLASDDAFEQAAADVIAVIDQLFATGALTEACEELGDLSLSFNRFVESRGLVQKLAENDNGLAQMAKRWQKAGNNRTAFQRIHGFCGSCRSIEEFEEILAGVAPANIDSDAWTLAVAAFNTRLEAYNEETQFELEPGTALVDVAVELVNKSRRAFDAVTEKFVNVLRDLQESGRLGGEMDEIDAALLPVVRNALAFVPQLQRQVQPQVRRQLQTMAMDAVDTAY